MGPLRPHGIAFKGALDELNSSGGLPAKLIAARSAAGGAVAHDPIEKGFFESDIVPDFLALEPLVAQDFFPLGEELLVEKRAFQHGGVCIAHWCQHG